MSENTTAETHPSAEPQPAAPVADAHAHAGEAAPEPASAESHEPLEPAVPAASEESAGAPAEPVAPVTTDDWSSVPETEFEAKKPAKKSRPRAKAAADPEVSAEESPAPVADGVDPVAEDVATAAAAAEGTPAEGTPAEDASPPEELAPPENKRKWYAIKVQSGREDTIKAAILRKVAIEGLEEVFSQILVPVDEVIEKRAVRVKDKATGEYTTQEKKVKRKIKKFQGYIFAEMEFNDRILYLIRETSGVGDFLKLRPRPNDSPVPEPMTDAEVKQMLGEKVGPETGGTKKVKIEFEKGDRVRIKEGSFKDTEGDVKEVILPKDPTDPPKVMVTVTFWGRPLDVELEYWQVTKA